MNPTTIVQVAVIFEAVIKAELNMSQEKFDSLPVETQELLIETTINTKTAKTKAVYVKTEILSEQDEIQFEE